MAARAGRRVGSRCSIDLGPALRSAQSTSPRPGASRTTDRATPGPQLRTPQRRTCPNRPAAGDCGEPRAQAPSKGAPFVPAGRASFPRTRVRSRCSEWRIPRVTLEKTPYTPRERSTCLRYLYHRAQVDRKGKARYPQHPPRAAALKLIVRALFRAKTRPDESRAATCSPANDGRSVDTAQEMKLS